MSRIKTILNEHTSANIVMFCWGAIILIVAGKMVVEIIISGG